MKRVGVPLKPVQFKTKREREREMKKKTNVYIILQIFKRR